jgi:hypothetical protein
MGDAKARLGGNEAKAKLAAARQLMGQVLGKRGPTTEAELNESAAALDEIVRAIQAFPRLPKDEILTHCLSIADSLTEIRARLIHRVPPKK